MNGERVAERWDGMGWNGMGRGGPGSEKSERIMVVVQEVVRIVMDNRMMMIKHMNDTNDDTVVVLRLETMMIISIL